MFVENIITLNFVSVFFAKFLRCDGLTDATNRTFGFELLTDVDVTGHLSVSAEDCIILIIRPFYLLRSR